MKLSELQDMELVNELTQNNNEEALVELATRHSGIFVDMVNKFGDGLTPTQKHDLIDSRDFYIHQAAQKYDPDKSKFVTFIGQTAKYLCLNQGTKNRKVGFTNFDDIEFLEEDSGLKPDEACMKHEVLEKILDVINGHPDERVRTIFNERYFNPNNNKIKTWKQISKVVGLSTQGCINLHDAVITNLQRRINYV